MTSVLDGSLPAAGVPAEAAGERGYYNISEAAALLGVSRISIWRWIRAGQLPAARLGHRTIRIKRGDLEQLLEQVKSTGPRSWTGRKLGAGAPAARRAGSGRAFAADAPETGASEPPGRFEHVVQFYETDAVLWEAVAEFIGAALRAGDAGVVVATPPHREALERRLQETGVDLAAARARGAYIALDAAETLSQFMVDRAPDPQRFAAVVGGLVAGAAPGAHAGDGHRRRVRIFGEMVALLVDDGNPAAAIRLEQLWNELQKAHAFSLFCAYPMERFGGAALAKLFRGVCAEHSRVIPAESYTALADPGDRLRAIGELQQKAQWLEVEIAERRRAQEALQAALASERAARAAAEVAREAAEAALRARDEFVSIAAHELKTPLTSLAGFAQLVLRRVDREGQVDPEQAVQALRTINGQSKKLARLLSQLLEVSRLDGGKLLLERQRTDLTAFLNQIVSDAQSWSARHVVTLQAPTALEAQVDPLRLEQVLTNLLDNAIKYSPAGGPIEVALARLEETSGEGNEGGQGGAGGGIVELSVRDRGVGIPPEKQGQIFERFYQAHPNGHHSGMGLGLYVCRQIVKLHGGDIRAEFPPDGGSRFVVRLPLGVDEAPAPPADPAIR